MFTVFDMIYMPSAKKNTAPFKNPLTIKSAERGPQLTKTKYCTGIQCLKALYLTIHQNDLASPPDESQQQRMVYGTKVGVEARKYYSGGQLIEADHFHKDEAIYETNAAMQNNVPAVFEAAFFWERTLVRVDILQSNSDGTWDIIEVKSTTSVKDEHIPDMAIQRYILEKCGIKVRSSVLKHINKECVFPKVASLFTDSDCTDRVKTEMLLVPELLKQMFSTLDKPNSPACSIGPQCDEPHGCAFKSHCWKEIPKHYVFELSGVWTKTKFELLNRGVTLISQIPDGEKVPRSKPDQIRAVKSDKPIIDKRGIQEWIKNLEYPLYFLDFETIGPPIPLFSETRPYQQIPFQFSCHVQEKPCGPTKHIEFLASSANDPREDLVNKLIEALGTEGSIVSYNAKFEKGIIESLARQFPSLQNKLLAANERFVDLLNVFKNYYFHPNFHGSNSIKATLPVLVPDMSYENLDVYNGIMAQIQYERMVDSKTPDIVKKEIQKSLLQYCSQDTLAMVKLLEALYNSLK